MTYRSRIAAAVGALGVAALASYAPAASADRVAFNIAVGGPGYALAVGNYGGYVGGYYAPAPVYVAPPAPYYRPYYRPYYAPVVVPPPVVVRPYPLYRPYWRDRYWDHRHDRWDHRRDHHRHDRWDHRDRH